METRMELQRLLEDMDKMIRRKQQELSELDDRLEVARARVSESEAQELLKRQGDTSEAEKSAAERAVPGERADLEEALREQRQHYEQQVGKLTEELVELESANRQLVRLNERLRAESDSSRLTGEQLKARLHQLSESLEEVRGANFELNIRLAKAESESQMQQRLLKKSHEQDQLLMDAFNKKLESLQEAIEARELEIGRLRQDEQLTLESLGIRLDDHQDKQQLSHAQTSAGLIEPGNRQRSIQIANLIHDRDAQIELLKRQLERATGELEANTNRLQQLTSERRAENKSQSDDGLLPPNDQDQSRCLGAKCRMLETELEVKDEQLNRIEWRNRQLELVLPVTVAEMIEKLRLALKRTDCKSEQASEWAERLDQGDKNLKLLVEELSGQLAELLARFESMQTMLMAVEQQQLVIKNKDAQIRRLVRELNRLSAEMNHDQIDLPDAEMESEAVQLSVSEHEPMKRPVGEGEPEPPTESSRERDSNQRSTSASKIDDQQESQAAVSSEGQLADNQQLDATGNNDDSISLEQQSAQQSAGQLLAAAEPAPSNMRKDSSLATSGQRASRLRGRVGHKNTCRRKSNRRRFAASNKKRVARARSLAELGQKHVAQAGQPKLSGSPTTTSVPRLGEGARAAAAGGHDDLLVRRHLERALELQQRLGEVENENQLLELAMKEILLAIKWSDTRCSSLLIDCPSLEHLCQLIEARYITGSSRGRELLADGSRAHSSGQLLDSVRGFTRQLTSEPPVGSQANQAAACDLFQFVVLKSELDLIRGQNEQLRSDLKLERRERLLAAQVDARPQPSKLDSQQQPAVDGMQEATEDDGCPQEESFKFAEVEIQTDSSIQIADAVANHQVTEGGVGRCGKCPRLISLASHLLDCFVRIESRVSASDETNLKRLKALYQLTQRLNQDLKSREQLIARHQRDLLSMAQQKALIDSKLRYLESQLEVHSKLCPMNTMSQPLMLPIRQRRIEDESEYSSTKRQFSANQIQVYAAASQNQLGDRSISTFSMQDGRKRHALEEGLEQMTSAKVAMVQLKERDHPKQQNNKVTVALLQSIIACLQARLDYKDERLNQLEQILAGEAAG